MSKTPTHVDLGDEFPDTSDEEVKDFVVIGPIFGIPKVRVLQNVNLFTVLAADTNPAKYAVLVSQAIHPDDRDLFLQKLQGQKNLDNPENLLKLVNRILEAAAGNPQNSSGASSAGTPRKAAARRSAV